MTAIFVALNRTLEHYDKRRNKTVTNSLMPAFLLVHWQSPPCVFYLDPILSCQSILTFSWTSWPGTCYLLPPSIHQPLLLPIHKLLFAMSYTWSLLVHARLAAAAVFLSDSGCLFVDFLRHVMWITNTFSHVYYFMTLTHDHFLVRAALITTSKRFAVQYYPSKLPFHRFCLIIAWSNNCWHFCVFRYHLSRWNNILSLNWPIRFCDLMAPLWNYL